MTYIQPSADPDERAEHKARLTRGDNSEHAVRFAKTSSINKEESTLAV